MRATDLKAIHELPKSSYLSYIKIFPITKTEEAKTYTSLILTLTALIIFSIFAISPTINTIIDLRRTLADSRTANQALEDKISALDALQTEYTTLGTDLDRINEAIPERPEVPTLFARIQTLAQSAGLTIVSMQSQEVELTKQTASHQPSSFVFDMTVSGPYTQTVAFLESLKDFDRIISIDTINVTRDTDGKLPLQTSIRARAFFHPEERNSQ